MAPSPLRVHLRRRDPPHLAGRGVLQDIQVSLVLFNKVQLVVEVANTYLKHVEMVQFQLFPNERLLNVFYILYFEQNRMLSVVVCNSFIQANTFFQGPADVVQRVRGFPSVRPVHLPEGRSLPPEVPGGADGHGHHHRGIPLVDVEG